MKVFICFIVVPVFGNRFGRQKLFLRHHHVAQSSTAAGNGDTADTTNGDTGNGDTGNTTKDGSSTENTISDARTLHTLKNIQKQMLLHHHGAGKSNRQRKNTSKKALFDQLTWLLEQHKSIKDQLARTNSHGNNHHKFYNKYFKKYFRSFRQVVDE